MMKPSLIAACLLGISPLSISYSPMAAAKIAPLSAVTPIVEHYAQIVYASYSDTVIAAHALEKAIQTFIQTPNAENLLQAQFTWKAARELYGQTEAFRFYGGPIDDDDGPEGQINAWPLDEAYIDGVIGNETAGIIQNPKIPITKEQLISMNEEGGEENVSTGWHAIEFLLWGQDRYADSAGRRPITDFTTHPFAERRKKYLATVARVLVEDLESLRDAWKPNASNYRASFMKNPQQSFQNILIGLGSLSRGELAGERLEVALVSRDQEDEHSCFSDNTHRDAVSNAQGIANVWFGTYTTIAGSHLKGPSLQQALEKVDPALAKQMDTVMRNSVHLAEKIQAPFDQEILNDAGRARIQATVDNLIVQSDLIVKAAQAFGIERLNLVEP